MARFELGPADIVTPTKVSDGVFDSKPTKFARGGHRGRGAEVLDGVAEPATQLDGDQLGDGRIGTGVVFPFLMGGEVAGFQLRLPACLTPQAALRDDLFAQASRSMPLIGLSLPHNSNTISRRFS